MLNLLTTAAQIYASTAKDIVTGWRFMQMKILPVLKDLELDSSVIETVTGLVSPEAVNIERAAFAILGIVVEAIDKLPDANGATSIQVDAELVAQVKAISAAIKKNMVAPSTVPGAAVIPGVK